MTFLEQKRNWFLLFGLGALGLTVLGGIFDPPQFFAAWLIAEIFWLGLALGSLAWAMIHYLTGGKWGNALRRVFESAMATLPLLLATFLPLLFGLRFLYPWAAGSAPADPVLQYRHIYMNGWAFAFRGLVVFAIWIALSWRLRTLSAQQDGTASVEPTRKLRRLSGPGLVIYPLTGTFAFVDWIMSAEKDWYSTMFPILICMGQMLAALSAAILVLFALRRRPSLEQASGPEAFHHLGSLLLACTMMWAYLAFSQFLIIWAGDLPHEIGWYLHRTGGGWKYIAILLVAFHFAVPFGLLLSRRNKKQIGRLAVVAGMVLAAHVIDVWWMITPSFHPGGLSIHWMDFTALLGIGGLWLGLFALNFSRHPQLPLNDPRFAMATAPV
jgi:hypothetical protein